MPIFVPQVFSLRRLGRVWMVAPPPSISYLLAFRMPGLVKWGGAAFMMFLSSQAMPADNGGEALTPAAPLRVFVIGDSISQQYGPFLEKLLSPRFTYDRKRDSGSDRSTNLDIPQGANGGDSRMVLAYLRQRAATNPIPADVLLLNCGLHDIKRDPVSEAIQVPLVDYCLNLRRILTEAAHMHLRVVWMRTTPVVDAIHNARSHSFHRFARDLAQYNSAADEIMREAGIPCIDLWSFSSHYVPESFADHVHYTAAVQEMQAAYISGALNQMADSFLRK